LKKEDGTSKTAFPNELIRTTAKTINNPLSSTTTSNFRAADKKILTKKKQVAKQTRILNKEGLDVKDIKKQQKLERELKKLRNESTNYKKKYNLRTRKK